MAVSARTRTLRAGRIDLLDRDIQSGGEVQSAFDADEGPGELVGDADTGRLKPTGYSVEDNDQCHSGPPLRVALYRIVNPLRNIGCRCGTTSRWPAFITCLVDDQPDSVCCAGSQIESAMHY